MTDRKIVHSFGVLRVLHMHMTHVHVQYSQHPNDLCMV